MHGSGDISVVFQTVCLQPPLVKTPVSLAQSHVHHMQLLKPPLEALSESQQEQDNS